MAAEAACAAALGSPAADLAAQDVIWAAAEATEVCAPGLPGQAGLEDGAALQAASIHAGEGGGAGAADEA
eukprot:6152610-Prymnesium_polylepis.1